MKTPNYRELIIQAFERTRNLSPEEASSELTWLAATALADTTAQPKASKLTKEPWYNIPDGAILIEFDGGSACNNPKAPGGYGLGYGSYRIDRGPSIKCNFGRMSANTAEILTACAAIHQLNGATINGIPRFNHMHLVGDSQIAMKWLNACAGNIRAKLSKGSSPEFKDAIEQLRAQMRPGLVITTEWHGRANSVRIFGH